MGNILFIEYQDKMVELFDTEFVDLEAGRLRIHRAPHACRFAGCPNADWYISDCILAYHQRKQVSDKGWKFPSSCPDHRNVSKQMFTAKNNTEICKITAKRSFRAEYDAATYASTLTTRQYPYNCDSCGNWHLSSLSPEQQRELEDRKAQRLRENNLGEKIVAAQAAPIKQPAPVVSAPSAPAVVSAPTGPSSMTSIVQAKEERAAKAVDMYKGGVRVMDIVKELGVSASIIYLYLREAGISKRGPSRSSDARTPSPNIPARFQPTDLDTQEAELLRQLEEVKRKKQLLEEAKRLRVEMVGENAFRITKEGEHATLPMSELEPLIDRLMSLVQPQQPEAVGSEAF
jgi:hypothetical protein